MDPSTWSKVDDYLAAQLVTTDDALDGALQACTDAGLPPINVTPAQGKLLMMLARLRGAQSILEIGTLGGYSTVWLARALPPGGKLLSLEIDSARADLARRNLHRAGLGDVAAVRVGPAAESLAALVAAGERFDFFFIDADKKSTPEYFRRALELASPGAVIVVDNVVRNGAVADANSTNADVRGIQQFLSELSVNPRVTATAIQTVGGKGYDGFVLATVDRE